MIAPAATWSAYWAPKAGTPRSDWEDGCAYSPSTGWFAVADGASSGVRSREWAFHLSRSFVAAGQREAFAASLGATRVVAWLEQARSSFDPDAAEFNAFDVPDWIRAASAGKGAYATLLGGCVGRTSWEVVAVGDCCLFHVSATGEVLATFPMQPGYDSTAAPMLVTSVAFDDDRLAANMMVANGAVAGGDCVFVTSDALAAWMLATVDDRSTWMGLRDIGNDGFQALCTDLRAAELLKNDDVTMLRIAHDGGSS
jgi:hypothetical protein